MRIRKKILNKFFIFISLFFLLCSIFLLANITPGLKGSIDQELRIILKQTDRIFSYNIQSTLSNFYSSIRYINKNNNKYEKLNIDISFKNLSILKKERKEALLLGKNLSRKKVPIQISFNGKKYKASARLKGGLSDHYGNNKQFSLMIKIRKGQSIDGMREFSLTQHFSRQFPQNIVYSDMLSSLGLATPKFITYKINLNGDDWGLMLAEEQYSDAYFELREKKYSPTVKFTNEDNSDIFRTLFSTSNINNDNQSINFINHKHGKIENKIYNRNDFKKFNYSNILSYSKDVKFSIVKNYLDIDKLHTIFDMDKFSKIFILAIITGDYHALGFRNMRYYINPFTRIFEPIPTDWGNEKVRKILNDEQIQKELFSLVNCSSEVCNRQDYILYDNIFKNKNFQNHFKKNLENFRYAVDSADIQINSLCEFQNNCKNKFESKLIKENLINLIKIINYQNLFDKKYKIEKIYKREIRPDFQDKYLNALNNAIYARVFSNGKLRLMNLTPLPIQIEDFSLIKKNCSKKKKGKKIKKCSEKFNFRTSLPSSEFEFFEFDLDQNLELYESLVINVKYQNKKLKSSEFDIESEDYLRLRNKKSINLNNFKFIGEDLIIEQGKTYITSPLILPKNYNMIISPGANLIFNQGSYIEIDGGNIQALGNPTNNISFESVDKKKNWNGILVKNSNKKSIFRNVVIKNLDYYKSFNTLLTGGINFYKSDVDFMNTEFINSNAEDFLNITHSKFKIINSSFINCRSDALDSDFSSGLVLNSNFSKINGDAADFSGSKVQISETKFNYIKDKAISAGEVSEIKSENNKFFYSNIAISSKDRSIVNVDNNNFSNSQLYDLTAFNKKSFYQKGGEIFLKNKNDKIDLKMKSDYVSKIFVNGKKIKNENFDLKEIY